jgi:hypothetical protein
MSKEMVLEKAKSYNFSKIVGGDDGPLMLYDWPELSVFRFYVLSFSDNKLVTLAKRFKPSMSNYILLFKELSEKYGNEVYCYAQTKLSSSGEDKDIGCNWNNGKELISIKYSVFPSNDDLYIFYSAVDKYIPGKVK